MLSSLDSLFKEVRGFQGRSLGVRNPENVKVTKKWLWDSGGRSQSSEQVTQK